ncbi:hypothetical protein CSIM01_13618 [Colletotrichum simmondsii]|uniref:Uncharacterized protein n=1 Tax=Colletotrichum simmondsii TaxID=703756 RepID=A0A135SJH8_9PEZI|nr:hypothetical protein CSIM01_13618 [Colletotrichum simmondsii]
MASFSGTASSQEPRRGEEERFPAWNLEEWPMGEPTAERRMDQEAPFSPLAYAGTGGKCCRNRHHGATLETPGAKDRSLDTTSSRIFCVPSRLKDTSPQESPSLLIPSTAGPPSPSDPVVPVSGCQKLTHALASEEGTGGSRCTQFLAAENPSLFASKTKSLFSNIVIIALAPAPSPPSVDLHSSWLFHGKSPTPAITRETSKIITVNKSKTAAGHGRSGMPLRRLACPCVALSEKPRSQRVTFLGGAFFDDCAAPTTPPKY